jgi:hypothetical protein
MAAQKWFIKRIISYSSIHGTRFLAEQVEVRTVEAVELSALCDQVDSSAFA